MDYKIHPNPPLLKEGTKHSHLTSYKLKPKKLLPAVLELRNEVNEIMKTDKSKF